MSRIVAISTFLISIAYRRYQKKNCIHQASYYTYGVKCRLAYMLPWWCYQSAICRSNNSNANCIRSYDKRSSGRFLELLLLKSLPKKVNCFVLWLLPITLTLTNWLWAASANYTHGLNFIWHTTLMGNNFLHLCMKGTVFHTYTITYFLHLVCEWLSVGSQETLHHSLSLAAAKKTCIPPFCKAHYKDYYYSIYSSISNINMHHCTNFAIQLYQAGISVILSTIIRTQLCENHQN